MNPVTQWIGSGVGKAYTRAALRGAEPREAVETWCLDGVGTALAFPSADSIPARRRGSNDLSNFAQLREGQLVEEIASLHRKVSDGRDGDDLRTKYAHRYLKELLRFKQETLDLLRYQRAGRGARWERHPEVH